MTIINTNWVFDSTHEFRCSCDPARRLNFGQPFKSALEKRAQGRHCKRLYGSLATETATCCDLFLLPSDYRTWRLTTVKGFGELYVMIEAALFPVVGQINELRADV